MLTGLAVFGARLTTPKGAAMFRPFCGFGLLSACKSRMAKSLSPGTGGVAEWLKALVC